MLSEADLSSIASEPAGTGGWQACGPYIGGAYTAYRRCHLPRQVSRADIGTDRSYARKRQKTKLTDLKSDGHVASLVTELRPNWIEADLARGGARRSGQLNIGPGYHLIQPGSRT